MQDHIDEASVVIVGAGPAGLTAAIALAREGIDTLVLERRPAPSHLPRANVISTANMERLRSWGLEGEVREGDLGVELQPWVTETLAAAAGGQALDAGFPTREQSAVISPTSPAGVPQDHLEPVLERHLRSVGPARVERGKEVTEIENGPSGVTLTARELDGGGVRRVRARYVIAADGIRSTVRAALGIPASRREQLGERLAVQFRAPLWGLLGDCRYAIYWLTGPSRLSVFVPAGLPDRWVFATDWDLERGRTAELTPSEVAGWIREAAGQPALELKVERIAPVRYGVDLAARFRDGSAFLIGDAAHRVTPRGATGLNTAMRDGYDLGWKLAWVLNGWAGDALLDSYEAERRPVAEHNAARSADANGSERSVTDALRADLGGRIPHLWLDRGERRMSTLDLLGSGLTLFTGPHRSAWETAAESMRSPVPVTVQRLEGLTARALGITGPGALLVRPDGVPAGLWSDPLHATARLECSVASIAHRGRSECEAIAGTELAARAA
jgi:putative polyketide hydroxylase